MTFGAGSKLTIDIQVAALFGRYAKPEPPAEEREGQPHERDFFIDSLERLR